MTTINVAPASSTPVALPRSSPDSDLGDERNVPPPDVVSAARISPPIERSSPPTLSPAGTGAPLFNFTSLASANAGRGSPINPMTAGMGTPSQQPLLGRHSPSTLPEGRSSPTDVINVRRKDSTVVISFNRLNLTPTGTTPTTPIPAQRPSIAITAAEVATTNNPPASPRGNPSGITIAPIGIRTAFTSTTTRNSHVGMNAAAVPLGHNSTASVPSRRQIEAHRVNESAMADGRMGLPGPRERVSMVTVIKPPDENNPHPSTQCCGTYIEELQASQNCCDRFNGGLLKRTIGCFRTPFNWCAVVYECLIGTSCAMISGYKASTNPSQCNCCKCCCCCPVESCCYTGVSSCCYTENGEALAYRDLSKRSFNRMGGAALHGIDNPLGGIPMSCFTCCNGGRDIYQAMAEQDLTKKASPTSAIDNNKPEKKAYKAVIRTYDNAEIDPDMNERQDPTCCQNCCDCLMIPSQWKEDQRNINKALAKKPINASNSPITQLVRSINAPVANAANSAVVATTTPTITSPAATTMTITAPHSAAASGITSPMSRYAVHTVMTRNE